jgi:hypothetical protein
VGTLTDQAKEEGQAKGQAEHLLLQGVELLNIHERILGRWRTDRERSGAMPRRNQGRKGPI